MIREVRREDIPECVQVIRRSHRTVADQFGFTEENAPRYVAFATDENRLLWHMYSEHRLMYADEEDGVIRGYYSLLLTDGDECELGNLSVLPEYRHRGIGTAFFRQLDEWAAASGIVRLELTVECPNGSAKALYEKNGFRVEGIRPKAMKVNGSLIDEYYMGKIIGEQAE